jgi:hypothetical protein
MYELGIGEVFGARGVRSIETKSSAKRRAAKPSKEARYSTKAGWRLYSPRNKNSAAEIAALRSKLGLDGAIFP